MPDLGAHRKSFPAQFPLISPVRTASIRLKSPGKALFRSGDLKISKPRTRQTPEQAGQVFKLLRVFSDRSFAQYYSGFRVPGSGFRFQAREVQDRVRDDAPRQFPGSAFCPLSSAFRGSGPLAAITHPRFATRGSLPPNPDHRSPTTALLFRRQLSAWIGHAGIFASQ